MFYHVLADIVVCNTVNYFIMIELFISLDARQALHVHLVDQCRSYQLQAAIFHEALFSSGAESNINSLHPFFFSFVGTILLHYITTKQYYFF